MLLVKFQGPLFCEPMQTLTANLTDTGLEVVDAQSDAAFVQRRLHSRDTAVQLEGMQRLARAAAPR